MGKKSEIIDGLKPAIMMVIVQIISSGVNVFYKLGANNGMSLQIMILYRFLFAAASLLPFALIIEWKIRPKMTWKIFLQAFVCGFFGGSLAQNLYAESLMLTSATYVAAITNLIPAMTFLLAIIFRMEGLGLKTMTGKAKVLGTVICIGGAMLLTFYKGCEIKIWSTHFDLMHKSQRSDSHVAIAHHKSGSNVLGLLLALAACFSVSLSLIIQAKMSEKYPCHYSSAALLSTMASIQAAVFALCMERDWTQWKLGWNIRLLTVAYMGILGSGVMWAFTMSCVRMRGPLFVSVFNPLLLVLVALAGSLLLNEKLHLGSVLGAVIIICGLYSVLWGKSKEMKKNTRLVPSHESFGDVTKVEEIGIRAMIPDLITDSEISQAFDGEDEESSPQIKFKT